LCARARARDIPDVIHDFITLRQKNNEKDIIASHIHVRSTYAKFSKLIYIMDKSQTTKIF